MNKRIRKKHRKNATRFSDEELHELCLIAAEVRLMLSTWQLCDYLLEKAERRYNPPKTTI